MPGKFPRHAPTSKETASQRPLYASRHVRHACAVMHVGIANLRWRGKRSRRMRNPQIYLSGKRHMATADIRRDPSIPVKYAVQTVSFSLRNGPIPDMSNIGLYNLDTLFHPDLPFSEFRKNVSIAYRVIVP